VIFVYAVTIATLMLATPVAVQALVNTVAFGTLRQPLIVLSSLLLMGLTFGAVLTVVQMFVGEMLGRRLFVRTVSDFVARVPRLSRDGMRGAYGPELVNRFFDIVNVQKTMTLILFDGMSAALSTGAGLLLLALYHPIMLALAVVLAAVMSFVFFVLGRGATDKAIAESIAKYQIAAWIEELARPAAVFRARGGREFAQAESEELTSRWLNARESKFRIVIRQYGAVLVTQVVTNVALLLVGGWLVIDRQLTLGQLVAAELVMAVVVDALSKLGKLFEKYYELLASLDKIGHVLDLPLEALGGDPLPRQNAGLEVQVANVTYGYGAEAVLNGLTLKIAPGERVALVGPPAAGKSTLVEILYAMRSPWSGHVTFDAADIRELSLESLRDQVALVRGFEIIAATVADNIRIGQPEIQGDEVRALLDRLDLADVVRELPKGVDTRLTPSGTPLNKDAARLLMVARALAMKPRLVIIDAMLDELQPDQREAALDALFDPATPWTVLCITSEPSALARCKRHIHIEHGRVVSDRHVDYGPGDHGYAHGDHSGGAR
jgi:putative ABC transport system ATP-binding protein